jgi:WD repeat-containing protein 7
LPYMEDEALLYPLVLPQIEDIISSSCAKATATCLAAWRTTDKPSNAISVAMGCQDGSIYFFHPEYTSSLTTDVSTQEPTLTSPSQKSKPAAFSALSKLYRPPSPTPSSTGSSHLKSTSSSKQASFQPSKSRVQAGVTKEQAEAPKNYVDYDEEPAKLKLMLKTRDTKDRGFLDSLMPSLSSHSHRPRSADGANQKVRKESSFSQPSVTNTSSTSTSPPASPIGSNFTRQVSGSTANGQTDGLNLVAHTLSPRLGEGRAVKALQSLEGGNSIASLQECGYAIIHLIYILLFNHLSIEPLLSTLLLMEDVFHPCNWDTLRSLNLQRACRI